MVKAYHPKTVKEALIWKERCPKARIYAGGTDFMVAPNKETDILFINQIKELHRIEETEETIVIGAACTYLELQENPLIPSLLKEAVKELASPAIRSIGTLGGNICNASPAGDMLPLLYVLEAKLKLSSQAGSRKLSLNDFILGVRKTALMPEELLEAIILPKESFTLTYYKKIGARKSTAISKVSFSGVAVIENDVVMDVRMAFGSVGTTVVRKTEIEALASNRLLSELPISEMIREYDNAIQPIDDQRSTAAYRKTMCLYLAEDFLSNIGNQISYIR